MPTKAKEPNLPLTNEAGERGKIGRFHVLPKVIGKKNEHMYFLKALTEGKHSSCVH